MVGLISGCLGFGSIYTKDRFTPLRYTQEARGLWVAEQDTRSHGYGRGGCLVFVDLRFWIAKDTQSSLTFPFALLSWPVCRWAVIHPEGNNKR
jgi:hypothetical protein